MEKKFFCKLCNKSFSNGRVLGGHVRSHHHKKASICEKEEEASVYLLRQNPKKSSKFLGSEENQCSVCEKVFRSPRALFGHMRHHFGKKMKGIQCQECGRGFDTLMALSCHTKCHSHSFGWSSLCPVKCKRSRRTRYPIITPKYSLSDFNEFPCGEIGQQVHETAICLMMLSRGLQFSDISYVSFGNKELYSNMRIVRNETASSVNVVDIPSEVGKPQDMFDAKNDIVEKKTENGNEDNESGCLMCDTETVNGTCTEAVLKPNETQSSVDFMEGIELDPADLESIKFSSTENTKYSCSSESGNDLDTNIIEGITTRPLEVHVHKAVKNRSPGGTRNCNEKIQASILPEIDTTAKLAKPHATSKLKEEEIGRKLKVHKCPICFRVFASGQALGGHKRAHLKRKSETREHAIALKQEPSDICDNFEPSV